MRASMAIPGFFTPVKIGKKTFVDGGLQNICPVDVFEEEKGKPNPAMIGVWLDPKDTINFFEKGTKPPSKPVEDNKDYWLGVLESATNTNSYQLYNGPYRRLMAYCDTLNVGTLDFNLSMDTKKALIESGKYGMMNYIKQYYPELIPKDFHEEHKETFDLMEKTKHPRSIIDFVKALKEDVKEEIKEDIEDTFSKNKGLHHQWKNHEGLLAFIKEEALKAKEELINQKSSNDDEELEQDKKKKEKKNIN